MQKNEAKIYLKGGKQRKASDPLSTYEERLGCEKNPPPWRRI